MAAAAPTTTSAQALLCSLARDSDLPAATARELLSFLLTQRALNDALGAAAPQLVPCSKVHDLWRALLLNTREREAVERVFPGLSQVPHSTQRSMDRALAMQGRALAMTAMHNLLGAQPDPELWAERGYQQVQRPLSHLPLGEGAAAGADLTPAQSLLHSLHSAGINISQDKAVGYAYVRSPAPAGQVLQAGAVIHLVQPAVAAAAAVQQGQQAQQQQQQQQQPQLQPQPQPKSLTQQQRLGHAGASCEAAAAPAVQMPAHPAVKREPGSADGDEDRKRRRAEEGILKLPQEPACGAALTTAAAAGVAPAVKQEAQPSVKREQQSCGRGAVQQQQEKSPPPSQQLLQDQPPPQGQPQPQQQQQVQALQGQPPARELGEAFVVYVDVDYDSIYCTLRFQVTERVRAGKLLKAACSKLQLALDLSEVVFMGPDGCRVHMDQTLAECGVESGDIMTRHESRCAC